MKNAFFETPHNEIGCVLSIKESNFNEKNESKFSHFLTVRAEGDDRKISIFDDIPKGFGELIDVTLAIEDTNLILTDNVNRAIQGNEAMQVM